MTKKIRDIADFENEFLNTREGQDKLKFKDQEINRLKKIAENATAISQSRSFELPTEDNSFSFGLIGDTHIGSLYECMGELDNFYKICNSKGIKTVLHAGDVIDGHKIYKGQEFEQSHMGFDKQLSHFTDDYPAIDKIKTYFITGNHDQSFTKLIGMNVGNVMVSNRSDFEFLGNDYASITFKTPSGRKFIAMLQHPGGGTAYAVSYHSQKIIESLSGGTKPNILGIGHYHKAEMLPNYRNVACCQVGTFQKQTPFMAGHASAAHVGGWIITLNIGTSKTMSLSITATFIASY
jgi:predicted phosphodiesterase